MLSPICTVLSSKACLAQQSSGAGVFGTASKASRSVGRLQGPGAAECLHTANKLGGPQWTDSMEKIQKPKDQCHNIENWLELPYSIDLQ